MSLIAAAQITAVATAVLAAFAILTTVFAIRAFRKQAQEVAILEYQTKRDIEQRRRAQAAQVFTWVGERSVHDGEASRPAACVRNSSGQPVYDISVGWGRAGAETWPVLLPGDENAARGAGSDVARGIVPIRIEFRDASGVRWRATSEGELTELPPSPAPQ
jgi:hypothetical protein